MNNIKSTFSIKDLENLSGIKAHTIRIWEKRYGLLEPMRTDTNIRLYDLSNLQKLLNVVLLTNFGYKISKISKLKQEEVYALVLRIQNDKTVKHHAISIFKVAMLNFDQNLFLKTYKDLLSEKNFNNIFFEVFIPFLEEIGVLWTTNTINPSHEHFISYQIKHKLLAEIDKLQIDNINNSTTTYVLYLPFEEIHDLGLLLLHYNILKAGYHCVYLGRSLPTDSLIEMKNHFHKIKFITYLTLSPVQEDLEKYIKDFENSILLNTENELHIFGNRNQNIDTKNFSEKIFLEYNVENFINEL